MKYLPQFHFCFFAVISIALVVHSHAEVLAQGVSFGLPESELTSESTVEERRVLHYVHESHPDWGYTTPQRDYFNVVPADPSIEDPPLRVILHGAGKSGDAALKAGMAAGDEMMHVHSEKEFCALYLDCRDNRANDWWWGYHGIKDSGETYAENLTPTEKRVLSTIEWVATSTT